MQLYDTACDDAIIGVLRQLNRGGPSSGSLEISGTHRIGGLPGGGPDTVSDTVSEG
jgi:hypothetical protein